jgi:hypothetical protein
MDKMLDEEVDRIFEDAFSMQRQAIERFIAKDIRDAAEKAWCATKRATDALILAGTGKEPERTPDTTWVLNALAEADPEVRTLVGRYYTRQGQLHGMCFYLGFCNPMETTTRRIRETGQYIQDARHLAGSYSQSTFIRGWNTTS